MASFIHPGAEPGHSGHRMSQQGQGLWGLALGLISIQCSLYLYCELVLSGFLNILELTCLPLLHLPGLGRDRIAEQGSLRRMCVQGNVFPPPPGTVAPQAPPSLKKQSNIFKMVEWPYVVCRKWMDGPVLSGGYPRGHWWSGLARLGTYGSGWGQMEMNRVDKWG